MRTLPLALESPFYTIVLSRPAQLSVWIHRCRYLLFQDLCLLTNGEGPHWLTEVPSLDQNFGLELIETALTGSSGVFFRHREFTGLLKDRVCALVIRLFSPSIKHPDNAQKARGLSFPTMVRLVRVASSLVTRFRKLLVAECEIFVSILIRFLDMDKPIWQRALVLEVMHGFCAQPELLESFSAHYDMQSKTTKVRARSLPYVTLLTACDCGANLSLPPRYFETWLRLYGR